jgi:Tol biopolymer transport system component
VNGREVIAWAVALAAIAAGGWAAWSSAQSNPAAPPMQFQLAELETSTLFSRPVDFVLSPDGQHLVFSARPTGSAQPTLWIRSLSSADVRPLTGTEGGTVPFWSPDSRTIAFAASGQLRKIGIDGRLPQKIADVAPTAGGSWSAGGTIVFAERSHLYRVPANGGTAEQISTDAEVEAHGWHRWPAFLPDGRHFITVRANSEDAVLSSLDSTERQRLFSTSSKVVPVAAGYLLFVRDSVLLAQPFDLTRRAVTGEAIPVAENIFTLSFTGNARGGSADFDASANGTLFHRGGGDPDSQIVWFDRSGKRLGIVPGPIAGYSGVALSPDASQLTFHLHTSKGGDIHVIELARGALSQITFQEGQHASSAFWIGDDRVGFASLRQQKSELFLTRVPPVDRQQTLIAEVGGSAAASNGTEVVWNRDGGLWMASLDSSAPPVQIATGSYPHFSPDGRWISYQSNASGRTEIYVQLLAPGSPPLRVSTEGGNKSRWGRDGRELFFLSPDGRLMAATLRLEGAPTVLGAPTELFTPDFRCFTCAFVPYEPGPDNQRFLILANVQEGRRIEPATLVFDWVRTLRR